MKGLIASDHQWFSSSLTLLLMMNGGLLTRMCFALRPSFAGTSSRAFIRIPLTACSVNDRKQMCKGQEGECHRLLYNTFLKRKTVSEVWNKNVNSLQENILCMRKTLFRLEIMKYDIVLLAIWFSGRCTTEAKDGLLICEQNVFF